MKEREKNELERQQHIKTKGNERTNTIFGGWFVETVHIIKLEHTICFLTHIREVDPTTLKARQEYDALPTKLDGPALDGLMGSPGSAAKQNDHGSYHTRALLTRK